MHLDSAFICYCRFNLFLMSTWSKLEKFDLGQTKTSYIFQLSICLMKEVVGLWPVFCSLVFFGTADINQERIVEEGGLDALLSLLETSENTTIHRVTAGAVANLAMNGNVFQQSTLQISHIWSRCTNNHLLVPCQNF